MKKWVLFIIIILGLTLVGWVGYYYWKGTPRYALYQMAKAIKNNDPQTFLLYVDMDKVVEGLVDSIIKKVGGKFSTNPTTDESKKEKPSNKNKGVENLISQLAKSLKPALEQQLINSIGDIQQRGRISPFAFAFLSHVKREGSKAQVSVRASKDDTYQFTMEKTSEQMWKMVKLDLDFFKLLKKARRAKEEG